jgi:hypothetical protein
MHRQLIQVYGDGRYLNICGEVRSIRNTRTLQPQTARVKFEFLQSCTATFWTIHPEALTLSSRNVVSLGHGRHTWVIAHTVRKRTCLFLNGCKFDCPISMATPFPVVADLLRLWVRIPPGTWMSVVSDVCCLCYGWSRRVLPTVLRRCV